jgi:hypothetical protein
MQRIVAVILVILLVAPPASGGQKPNAPVDWDRVERLKAGTKITLTVTGNPPTKVRILFADETTLVTLKPAQPKLAGRVERTLLSIGSKWPAVLNRGESFEDGRVRVLPEGVFDGAQKVANLVDLVQQTPRGDVLSIPEAVLKPPHSHWVRNILIGFVVAAVTIIVILLTVPYFQS